MNLFRQLIEKPWETTQDTVVPLHGNVAFALPTVTVGLRVFLAVATVVFSLLIVMYTGRMTFGDWHPLSEPWLLWPNTAILLLSSIAMQWASACAQSGKIDGVRLGLRAAGLFAFTFLAGQLWTWQELVALGYYASSNPANGFFYLLTSLHGLHLIGGLVAWGRTTKKMRRGVGAEQLHLSIQLCAVYWHFLLVVWLVLFGLLLFT